MNRKIPIVSYKIDKNKKKKGLEITVCCRSMKEYCHMIVIVVYLQHILKITNLQKKDNYPKNIKAIRKWAKETIHKYKKLIPPEKTITKKEKPIIVSKNKGQLLAKIRR